MVKGVFDRWAMPPGLAEGAALLSARRYIISHWRDTWVSY